MKKVLFIFPVLCLVFFSTRAFSADIGIGGNLRKSVKDYQEIKTQNVVTQSLDFSCGPASLATILNYYFEEKVTEDEIIKFLLLTTDLEKVKQRKGFSLLDLKNFARYKGYDVVGYKMDLEYLIGLKKPVLIPIEMKEYSHFVIFRGIRNDRVFLADPAQGNMTMRVERFMNIWENGIGLVLSKAGEQGLDTPLKLKAGEKAVFADPAMVRQFFGSSSLGQIYGQGEF